MRPRPREVREANAIAKNAILSARWAVEKFDATVTLENPYQSYLWICWTKLVREPEQIQRCAYELLHVWNPIPENTRFRVWNGDFQDLGILCSKLGGVLVCGNTKHVHLGFG